MIMKTRFMTSINDSPADVVAVRSGETAFELFQAFFGCLPSVSPR